MYILKNPDGDQVHITNSLATFLADQFHSRPVVLGLPSCSESSGPSYARDLGQASLHLVQRKMTICPLSLADYRPPQFISSPAER